MPLVDMQFHGSDIEKVEQLYHIKKEEIINYSGNVNPLGLSESVMEALRNHIHLISSYPDRDYESLKLAIGHYVGVHASQVLVGNGSTELISLFIKTTMPKKALIIGPTYSEYEREIRIQGGKSSYYALKESEDFIIDPHAFIESIEDDIDLLVICNPNNPTSTAITPSKLRIVLDYCLAHAIHVLVDETYVEFTDVPVSACSFCETYPNLFIVRGVSKFFAAPGLRLGYGITGDKDCIKTIDALKNPWSINALAAYAGELMLKDHTYIQMSQQLIASEKQYILNRLQTLKDLKVFTPAANFILVKLIRQDLTAADVFEHLIRQKMMIRDAASFPFLGSQFFRFCLHTHSNNVALLDALEAFLKA